MKRARRHSGSAQQTQMMDFLYSLIGGVPYGVIAYDLDGIVTVANNKALAHLAVERTVNHVVDRPVAELLTGIPALQEAFQHGLTGGDSDDEYEMPDERVLAVRRRSMLRGGLLTIDDVTQRVNANRELARTAALLTERNRELEELAFVAAHDLKSPVVSVLGILDLLEDDHTLNRECHEMVTMASSSAARMQDTITGLGEIIAVRQSLSAQRENLDPGEVYNEVATLLAGEIKESGVEIRTDFRGCNSIRMSRTHLRSVMQNLMSNAIRYRSPDRRLLLRVTGAQSGSGFRLDVEDNGLGIDLERSGHKLFRIFESLHDHPDSQGLGLHIVDSIVRSYGGRMEVASEVGVGTTMSAVIEAGT